MPKSKAKDAGVQAAAFGEVSCWWIGFVARTWAFAGKSDRSKD